MRTDTNQKLLEGSTTPLFCIYFHPHNSRPNPDNAATLRRHEDAATSAACVQDLQSFSHQLRRSRTGTLDFLITHYEWV
jgi:hypothetical protein